MNNVFQKDKMPPLNAATAGHHFLFSVLSNTKIFITSYLLSNFFFFSVHISPNSHLSLSVAFSFSDCNPFTVSYGNLSPTHFCFSSLLIYSIRS